MEAYLDRWRELTRLTESEAVWARCQRSRQEKEHTQGQRSRKGAGTVKKLQILCVCCASPLKLWEYKRAGGGKTERSLAW